VEGFLIIIFSTCLILTISLWLYCINDFNKRKSRYLSQKAGWLNILILFPLAGSLIYLVLRKDIFEKEKVNKI
jgi:hypothetical protein